MIKPLSYNRRLEPYGPEGSKLKLCEKAMLRWEPDFDVIWACIRRELRREFRIELSLKL